MVSKKDILHFFGLKTKEEIQRKRADDFRKAEEGLAKSQGVPVGYFKCDKCNRVLPLNEIGAPSLYGKEGGGVTLKLLCMDCLAVDFAKQELKTNKEVTRIMGYSVRPELRFKINSYKETIKRGGKIKYFGLDRTLTKKMDFPILQFKGRGEAFEKAKEFFDGLKKTKINVRLKPHHHNIVEIYNYESRKWLTVAYFVDPNTSYLEELTSRK